jgi:uncharacterized protein
MIIIWDEPKREANLLKHGLDFARFEDDFNFGTFVILEARRSANGRIRWKMIGEMGGEKIVAAIVSPLGREAISLVNLRRANAAERRLYEKERQS